MKLSYQSIKDESALILTNFNCGPSQQLLQSKDLFKIVWSRDAATTVELDGYKITMEQNQVLFCTPVNVLKVPQDVGVIAIVFNKEFYCIRDHDAEVSCNGFLFFGSSLPQTIDLSEKDQKSYDALFYLLQEEFTIKDHVQGEMLRVLLKRLLIQSTRLLKDTLPDTRIPAAQLDIIRQYNVLVEQNFKEKHQVADYAELLFKSPKTLSNVFKKMGDKSPLKIINERIVLEAKRLLLYSNMTAEEIAYELGYREPAHFSKFFKNQVGVAPGSFKKRVVVS